MREIQAAFSDLLTGAKSREDVADWATLLVQADDRGVLTVEPLAHKQIIWDAILYLTGVDLKESAEGYLHSLEDFSEYWRKIEESLVEKS